MSHLEDELDFLRGRVKRAQAACDAALAARHHALEAFQNALDEIHRAAREGGRIGDLSEARRLRIALRAGDLRERQFEATQAFELSCEELKAAVQLLTAALDRRRT